LALDVQVLGNQAVIDLLPGWARHMHGLRNPGLGRSVNYSLHGIMPPEGIAVDLGANRHHARHVHGRCWHCESWRCRKGDQPNRAGCVEAESPKALNRAIQQMLERAA
jgi:hypothetical protein